MSIVSLPAPGVKGDRACPYCGATGEDLQVTRLPESSVHHASISCRRCNRSIGYAPKPMSLADAMAWPMPYGKCRGETLGSIAATEDGLRYLSWVSEHTNKTGRCARMVVEAMEGGAR